MPGEHAISSDWHTTERSDGAVMKPLGKLWHSLESGRAKILDSFATSERLGFAVSFDPYGDARPIETEQILALKHLILTTRQKVVSMDLGVGESTVSRVIKSALASMGLPCLPSRIPLLLVVAAVAAHESQEQCVVRTTERLAGQNLFRTISIERPNSWLAKRLTQCQCRVVALRVDSKSLHEISDECGTSLRTVANHLAASYQKLGVSGRFELLSALAAEYIKGTIDRGPTCRATDEALTPRGAG